ncbi:MAG: hypothetical protein MRERV_12c010 [Mycoplasmataceae bacterium RV_VA103A]|nr:MAG: hypothetical protein MRERV_12c010 [Mycoplasmataceae bacterium RV_VA103A]
MDKNQYPTLIVGIKLTKNCPRGIRERCQRWLRYKSLEQLKKNIYLLEENDYQIWNEYFSPLVKKYGEDFAYTLK